MEKKKASFWSNMVGVGGKAAVFVLSIKQHKTILGKESPIDHIYKLLNITYRKYKFRFIYHIYMKALCSSYN